MGIGSGNQFCQCFRGQVEGLQDLNGSAGIVVAVDIAKNKAPRHFNVQPAGVWFGGWGEQVVHFWQGKPGKFGQLLTVYTV